MKLPSDPYLLLSVVNTKLRDEYPSLAELCASLDLDMNELTGKLQVAGFSYDPDSNQFKAL